MSREFTEAFLRLGGAGGETAAKVGVFAPDAEADLAVRIHGVDRARSPWLPINLRMSKQEALRLAVKLVEAAAHDSALGTSRHRPGTVRLT